MKSPFKFCSQSLSKDSEDLFGPLRLVSFCESESGFVLRLVLELTLILSHSSSS